jgi:transcriptional regulator with XRE-family HTH domain
MTGMDLRLLRVSKRIKAQDVAAAMGVTHGRVSQIEAQVRVNERTTLRYLTALRSLEAVA